MEGSSVFNVSVLLGRRDQVRSAPYGSMCPPPHRDTQVCAPSTPPPLTILPALLSSHPLRVYSSLPVSSHATMCSPLDTDTQLCVPLLTSLSLTIFETSQNPALCPFTHISFSREFLLTPPTLAPPSITLSPLDLPTKLALSPPVHRPQLSSFELASTASPLDPFTHSLFHTLTLLSLALQTLLSSSLHTSPPPLS
ncbi:unnamed protein product [Closterium sp. Naga37s-1]|nr:unnamed protein product [Closterium sp. Naga37s-1]